MVESGTKPVRLMEGNIYNVSWKKSGQQFKLWLEDRPEISAKGADFEEVAESLADLVCLRLGDGEAAFEYEPPAPVEKTDKPIITDQWVMLGATENVEPAYDEQSLYSRACNVCGAPQGARNSKPVKLRRPLKANVARDPNSHTLLRFYSEQLVDLLKSEANVDWNWRQVEFEKESKKVYYECVDQSQLKFVGLKGGDYLTAACRACPKCSYRSFLLLGTVSFFVAESDIPPGASAFLVGFYPNQIDVCVTMDVWKRLKTKLKGIRSEKLGVASDAIVDRNPPLPLMEFN